MSGVPDSALNPAWLAWHGHHEVPINGSQKRIAVRVSD